jgi:uncharacterized protein (TIGR02421 family)
MQSPPSKSELASLISETLAQLAEEKAVRMSLAGGGRLHLDRRVPFLCVYRRRPGDSDLGTEQVVAAKTAYLIIPAEPKLAAQAIQLLRAVVESLAQHFGGFLLVEVWSAPLPLAAAAAAAAMNGDAAAAALLPRFQVLTPGSRIPRATVESLSKSLGKNTLPFGAAEIVMCAAGGLAPPGLKPLARLNELRRWNCFLLGLAVRPVYRDEATHHVTLPVLRSVRRSVHNALRQAFFTFSRQRMAGRAKLYYALGRRSVVKAVLDIDQQLTAIDRSFDLLLQATPVNAETAWREFRRNKFDKPPVFYYRPSAVDPALLKRQLYLIPVERIDDPTLSYLFRQKQEELDRQITLLSDIDTPRFLPESLQIYGGVSDSLLASAQELLDRVPTRSGEESVRGQLGAAEFAQRAQAELGYYQQQCADFNATVAVRDDMYAGMMVSGHQLLIGGRTRVPRRRVDALLQHEIGTHLVTRYNGHRQPFQQLEVGLAGYDGLQEGLAVLAEYLVGGLSRFRLRVLAARVVAARRLLDGASFIDTFRTLDRNFEFSQRTAYTITMRIYRGGGLTKDAVYLRGLLQILRYLREGGDLEPLYLGKVASAHLPLIAELRHRDIIKPPALRPRYLDDPAALAKIEGLREGLTVLQLLNLGKDV